RDFELWNAWYRVWALGSFLSQLRYRRALVQFRRTRDRRYLDDLENHEYHGTPSPEIEEYQHLFMTAYGTMCDVEAGRLSVTHAIAKLYALYRGKPWIPEDYGLNDPTRRYATAGDLRALARSTYWGYARAPLEVRRRYFDFPATEIIKDVAKAMVKEARWLGRLRDAMQYASFEPYRSAQSPIREGA